MTSSSKMQLADRHSGKFDIELWLLENDRLLVQVYGDNTAFNPDPKDGVEAMDMYNHPFAYYND